METQSENWDFSRPGSCDDPDGIEDVGVESSILSGNFFLDHAGEVTLTQNSDGLSWKSLDSSDSEGSNCLGFGASQKFENAISFSDIYAVEFADYGSMHCSKSSWRNARLHTQEMYRFSVHGLQKSVKEPCVWKLAGYTFGHANLETCKMWMNRLKYFLIKQVGRPKSLLVFVHPRSGKGNGCKTWETVSQIFTLAKVKTKVIVTERAGHASDVMASISIEELHSYDGVIAVGGDGFFNEIFNGYLLSRLEVPLPPPPSDSLDPVPSRGSSSVPESGVEVHETNQREDHPLLPDLGQNESDITDSSTVDGSCEGNMNKDTKHLFNGGRLRFGLIPAGSTDAIVISTTGARDPITSALHIVLGRAVRLDAVQVVRWKSTSASSIEPCVRYAASFAGYGFYGDVISESEKYRWMGPKRYDCIGTKVFLEHRSYEAEVMYEEVEPENAKLPPQGGCLLTKIWPFRNSIKPERIPCRVGCNICVSKEDNTFAGSNTHPATYLSPKGTKWSRSRGRFLSIGAAVMSNRNERAPDGLVADAHLSDGFLHLIMIRDCCHPKYLCHLIELTKRGGDPLNFGFVECHKTRAFRFSSIGRESVWNLDGEMFQAHQLSAQVLRGLIPLFASGPQV